VAGGFQPFENWPLLELDGDVTRQRRNAFALITNHEFTDAVFAYRDEGGDDFRRIVDHRLLSGNPIEANTLFREYLDRYDDASEGGDRPLIRLSSSNSSTWRPSHGQASCEASRHRLNHEIHP